MGSRLRKYSEGIRPRHILIFPGQTLGRPGKGSSRIGFGSLALQASECPHSPLCVYSQTNLKHPRKSDSSRGVIDYIPRSGCRDR